MGRHAWAGSKIKGMGSTERRVATAWIQYTFNDAQQTVNIQIYRYSWVIWEKRCPIASMGKTRKAAIEWCTDWKFLYIRERVTQEMSDRYTLKHQDGTEIAEG